jgi:hypothetical protein
MRIRLNKLSAALLILLVWGIGQCRAQNVTVTGVIQGANGLPAANTLLNFTPTQTFFVPGTNTTQQVGNIGGDGTPTGVCAIAFQFYTNILTNQLYQCVLGGWVLLGGGSSGAGITQIIGPNSAVTGAATFAGPGVTQGTGGSAGTFTFGGATGTYVPLNFSTPTTISTTNGAYLYFANSNGGQYNPGAGSYFMWNYGPGYDLGNNGSSAQGWSGFRGLVFNMSDTARGIAQEHSVAFTHSGQGDTSGYYGYLNCYGGTVASSDEGCQHFVIQTHQKGYGFGSITGSPAVGATSLAVSGYNTYGYNVAFSNYSAFDDGAILIDSTQSLGSITLGTESSLNGTISYALTSGTVPVSTASGTLIPASCTPNGNGQWQLYTTTSCNVTVTSGTFTTSSHVCLAQNFQEEVAVTAVGPPGAVQNITFATRYAWNAANNGAVFQGPPCGEAMVVASSIPNNPIAYAIIGASSPTQIYISNCAGGNCNVGGNIPPATSVMNTYPMAFITGGDGKGSNVYLGTNSVAWAASDVIDAAPTSEYAQVGIRIAQGQSTPGNAEAIEIDDDGPFPLTPITVKNGGSSSSYAPWAAGFFGYYGAGISFGHRLESGALLQVGGSGPDCEDIFKDNSSYGRLTYCATANTYNFSLGTAGIVESYEIAAGPGGVQSAGPISSGTPTTICGSAGGCYSGVQSSSADTPVAGQWDIYMDTAGHMRNSVGTVSEYLGTPQLQGTTGTITGTALSATCDSGAVTVTGATVGHPVQVSSTTGADVGGAFNLRASVTAANTVTVYVCGTGTPASLAYTVGTY